jgi:arginyl-tRNA synthetase
VTDPRPIAALADLIARAAGALLDVPAPAVPLAPPTQEGFGDLATPVAMALARQARQSPREIAEGLAERLAADDEAARWIAGVAVAGPGFLNLTLAPAWFAAAARGVAGAGTEYGADQAAPPERILLEFVSSNPTGPPHVGHARHAAYGDSLARILAFAGHHVTREFYVNDYGRQMELFGASVAARYGERHGLATRVPEDGYHGDYVADLAAALGDELADGLLDRLDPLAPDVLALFAARGAERMMDATRFVLERFRVRFDAFFSETALHRDGHVAAGVAALEAAGDAYRHDGALWFRTSAYGDEKDRVLVRADGATTYLAADVAYHLEKASRGYDRLIDVLGADHHGYVARLKAVLVAGGHAPDLLEVPIVQLVSLLERGEAKRMSKRAGTLVTLSDLIDDIGVDAARFFLVQRSHETPLDLDLDLAREQSQENPVYYVQYAHARVAGILAQAPAGGADRQAPTELDPSERALVLRLLEWPEAVREAEQRRAPHRVGSYLIDLARDFHAFYHRCRVVGEAPEVEAFRLDVCRAVGSVTRLGLDLLGVEAPERM